MCDDGCTVELKKENINFTKTQKAFIQGYRNRRTGLWEIPLNSDTPYKHKINENGGKHLHEIA